MNSFATAKRLWRHATKPHPGIADVETQHRARLLNGLLISIIPTQIIAFFIQVMIAPASPATVWAYILGLVIILLLYIFNHATARFHITSYVAMVLGFAIILAVAATSDPPHHEFIFLIFLPLVSPILFPLSGTLVICVLTTGLGLTAAWLMKTMTADFFNDLLIFTVLSQAFIIFVARQRDRLEVDRQHLAIEHARNSLLTTLLTNLSHDFRTPLSIINTSAYLMAHTNSPDTRQMRINQITQQTERLDKIMSDILILSRLQETNDSSLRMLDLHEVMANTLAPLSLEAQQKGVQLTHSLEPNLPRILGNHSNLTLAFQCIIRNAINFTPAGGSVSIHARRAANRVIIEISDTGIGIRADDLPQIFDPFFRGDTSRPLTSGGAGLGLSIAKRAVELHRGSVEVESALGKGSTFRVILPSR